MESNSREEYASAGAFLRKSDTNFHPALPGIRRWCGIFTPSSGFTLMIYSVDVLFTDNPLRVRTETACISLKHF
jgi:hypothetical protein